MSRSQAFSKRFSFKVTALTALLLTNLLPFTEAQAQVQVSANDGLLSVQASNTPASALAEALSNELGISVVVTGDAETLVNIDIIDEPLSKALAKLSPNHLLVRSDKRPDSSIVEVVLMMGEGDSSSSDDGQFLPTGSPADDIGGAQEEITPEEAEQLRDPNRSEEVRMATEEASYQTQDAGAPSPETFDPVTGLPIDPNTGLPTQ